MVGVMGVATIERVERAHPPSAVMLSGWCSCDGESMVDIQSATAEIRRGGEEEREETGNNIMSASATQGNHHNVKNFALNKRMRRPDLP